jgi:hypothetical protein
MINFAYVEEETFASHALAFLVRGLCTDLKHIIAYFFTKDLTSFQLMPLFWRAVSVLELSLQLYVCAAVNDGALANRKFFRLHSQLAQDLKCDVVYKTRNVFAMHTSSISLQTRLTSSRQLGTVCTTPVLVPAADICGTMANSCCFIILLTSFIVTRSLHFTHFPS